MNSIIIVFLSQIILGFEVTEEWVDQPSRISGKESTRNYVIFMFSIEIKILYVCYTITNIVYKTRQDVPLLFRRLPIYLLVLRKHTLFCLT